jgi:phosphoribosylaminoimidazole (AIR) synthetase
MYHVFNMGLGMAVICAAAQVEKILQAMPEAKVVGQVIRQTSEARVIIQ